MTPLVSVIISVYNCEKYIASCIESIIQQTYKNIEIIICDDGSTDKTNEIIKTYITKVKYIYQENQGQGAGRNNAVQYSQGEYLAFIDADDMWYENKIELQMSMFEKDQSLAAVYSEMMIIDENQLKLGYHAKGTMKRGMIFSELLAENFIGLSSLIVKKNAFEQCGGFSEHRYCQDFVLLLKLASKFNFDFVNKPLVSYRQHSQSVTSNLQLSYGEPIEYFKTVPLEYKLTDSQKLIWEKKLLDLYVSFAYLSYMRKEYQASIKIIVSAQNIGLNSWKLSSLKLMNKIPFRTISGYLVWLQQFMRILFRKLAGNHYYK